MKVQPLPRAQLNRGTITNIFKIIHTCDKLSGINSWVPTSRFTSVSTLIPITAQTHQHHTIVNTTSEEDRKMLRKKPNNKPLQKLAMSPEEYDNYLHHKLEDATDLLNEFLVKKVIVKSILVLMQPQPPYATDYNTSPPPRLKLCTRWLSCGLCREKKLKPSCSVALIDWRA